MDCEYQNMCDAKSSDGIVAVNCKLKVISQTKQEQTPLSGSIMFDPSCPSTNDGTPCPAVMDTVVCDVNGRQCPYNNICKAKATIGIDSSKCESKQVTIIPLPDPNQGGGSMIAIPILMNPEGCPSDTNGTFCPEVMDPYVCNVNELKCTYGNICKAKATIGIDPSKCERGVIIPLPDPNQGGGSMPPIPILMNPEGCPSDTNGTFCPQVMDPYVCNVNELKCTYGNSCKAKATIGIDPSKCERGVSVIPLPNPIQGGGSMTPIPILMNPEGCPSDMNGTFCPEVMDPYVCNVNELKCTYGNSCKANMIIGVDSTKCTKVTKNETDIKLNETKSDPKQVFDSCQGLPMKFPCTREYSPLACEYKDTVCKFTNLCIAYSILGEQGSGKCRPIEANVFLG